MRFYYGRQDFCSLERAQENCILLTNGLGGYIGVTSAGSVNRCDQGIFVAAVRSPNVRIGMVHRVKETLITDEKEYIFSTQKLSWSIPSVNTSESVNSPESPTDVFNDTSSFL